MVGRGLKRCKHNDVTFDDGRKAFANLLSAATIKDLGAKPVEQKCFQRTKTVFIFWEKDIFIYYSKNR